MNHRHIPAAPVDGAPLEQARAAFEWLVSGPSPLSVDGRALRGLPGRAIRIDALRAHLGHPSTPAATRDVAWAHLVRRSRARGGAWTVACVGVALPALVATGRRLCRDLRPARHGDTAGPRGRRGMAGAVADIESAVLSGFLAELATVDLRRPNIPARLSAAAHDAGRAARREIHRAPIPRATLFTSAPPPAPARHPDLVLARAVAAGALSHPEAVLIGSTRLEPHTLAELARARGHTLAATRAARVRAERKLAEFLRTADPDSTASTDTPLRTATTHGPARHPARPRRPSAGTGNNPAEPGRPVRRTARLDPATAAPGQRRVPAPDTNEDPATPEPAGEAAPAHRRCRRTRRRPTAHGGHRTGAGRPTRDGDRT